MIRRNVIEQGPDTSNHSAILAFGLEGEAHPSPRLDVVDNLFVNDAGRGGFINYRRRPALTLSGNRFVGPGRILPDGGALPHGNAALPSREAAGLPPFPALPMPDCP